MTSTIEPLVRDLVEWVAKEPRAYQDVMDAWRTSCPRFMVWEDAVERGLLQRERAPDGGLIVVATEAGHAFVASRDARAAGR